MKRTAFLFVLIIMIFGLQFSSCNKKDKTGLTEAKIIVTVKLNGSPVENATVLLVDKSDMEIYKTTGADGKVEFKDLNPDWYEVDADYTDPATNVGYYAEDGFYLYEGETKKVTLNLHQ